MHAARPVAGAQQSTLYRVFFTSTLYKYILNKLLLQKKSHVRSAGRPPPSCNDSIAVVLELGPERRGAGEMWREVTLGAVSCGSAGTSSPYSSRILACSPLSTSLCISTRPWFHSAW